MSSTDQMAGKKKEPGAFHATLQQEIARLCFALCMSLLPVNLASISGTRLQIFEKINLPTGAVGFSLGKSARGESAMGGEGDR